MKLYLISLILLGIVSAWEDNHETSSCSDEHYDDHYDESDHNPRHKRRHGRRHHVSV